MKKLYSEIDNLPPIIQVILGLISGLIIIGIIFLFFGISHVSALTPVEANFNYTQNGQSVSYNIKPDGGTTGFIYENEFYGQTISHSAYKHYLPASGNIGEITTTNINGYFQNPCSNGEDISYTMKINFYKQPSDENTMAWVRVTNGIDGCTGYFEVINGVYTYNNVCNLKAGDVPKFSLYFNESSRGQTYYRVGIPINFSYTCQVGNQAIIDANNANTNKMIEIINSATNSIQTTLNTMHCEKINNNNIKEENKRLANDGTTSNDNGFGITDYINIENAEIQILRLMTSYSSAYGRYCFYNSNKEYVQCYEQPTTTGNITIPTDAYYVRFTIRIPQNRPEYAICRNSTDAIIENQNQNTNRMIDYMIGFHEAEEEDWEEEKGLLQSILSAIGGIFSSSIDDPSNTLNSFNNSIASNGTITSLLLLPVTIYQKVINSINSTCVDITLGTLWNTTLTMPCLHIDGIIGNALYGTIDVIISGFFILAIRKRFISIFNNLSSLKTGGNELE